jgi:transcriptional regulator with XRE-family HTH domain
MVGNPLRITPINVDAPERGSKNGAMTKDQLRQFAEALRAARAKLDLNKTEFCKKAGITTNTLRALERGAQHPNPETLARLEKAVGPLALTSGRRPIEATDPLLAQLNDEDLEIAQAFHHAPMRVRLRVLGVLQERTRRRKESMTRDVQEWAHRLLALDPEKRQAMAALIESLRESDVLDEVTLEITRRLHALAPEQQQSIVQFIERFEEHGSKAKQKDHGPSRHSTDVSSEGTAPPRKTAAH